MFGFVWAAVVVSVASTIGATLAFLASRFLFRDLVQRRFGQSLAAINQGIEKDGAFYINLVRGLTPIRTATFYWVSQVGMLPGTLVYVNAGTQIGRLESLGGILSPEILFSFIRP